jgi:hypothetical protein
MNSVFMQIRCKHSDSSYIDETQNTTKFMSYKYNLRQTFSVYQIVVIILYILRVVIPLSEYGAASLKNETQVIWL